MNTIQPAIYIISPRHKLPPGYTKLSGHIIFVMKMDFTYKNQWVKDGHLTIDPVESNFAGVVSCER